MRTTGRDLLFLHPATTSGPRCGRRYLSHFIRDTHLRPQNANTGAVSTTACSITANMLVNKAVQFAVLTAAVLLESNTEAARTAAVKFCGRQLSEIMSRVCHAYNSPSWDVPTVVEQPGGSVRRKRQLGIADECCIIGCTWDQLSEYCSIVSYAYSDSPQENPDEHVIADRSAEQGSGVQGASKATPTSTPAAGLVKNAARAAPVVGTVSPLITWGRTLNTNLPLADRERYAYVVST
ncbi:hypothetical protein K1T71_005076 [Dendrolimus kikuchii]|uniref:Uncharacterized protein n=1 Tax=Dendrolimus kikuchii TaxID=765133 RepID=A0ACC1D6K8_9NEOP|nr:hypothetical protein K1T71_005076 [Dendrolimus kikuchii]